MNIGFPGISPVVFHLSFSVLFRELMPKLPSDGVFSVNCLLCKGQQHSTDTVVWQWRDDRGMWHPYTLIDIKIVEVKNSHLIYITRIG